MKLAGLKDTDRLERYFSRQRKSLSQVFRRSCGSKPIFVLGMQRSGTTMLMYAFHRHPQTLVFDEHRSNRVYKDHRLRSFDIVQSFIDKAKFPAVCFKPICDSHLVKVMNDAFPNAHFIWAYRDYKDVANSSMRKFDTPTRAVRLVCTGQPGGGWFAEGVSPSVAAGLRGTYRADLTDFDLACLSWWARNQIIVESGLINEANVTLVQYEALVSQPEIVLKWLFDRLGLDFWERVASKITPKSIGRHPAPEMDNGVRQLCSTGLTTLDNCFQRIFPSTIRPTSISTESSQLL